MEHGATTTSTGHWPGRTVGTVLRHTALGIALLLVAPMAAAASADAEVVDVELSVVLARMVAPDEQHEAAFEVSGACLATDGAVRVVERSCGDGEVVSRGTLGMARVGFNAQRRVEAGEQDLPLLETRAAAAPQQLSVVSLELVQGGDVRVEVAAQPTDELDPTVVPGSASEGGTSTERAVVWELGDAEAGEYRFSVRFAPNADDDFTGNFVPQVTITRSDRSSLLLEHTAGAVPAPGIATRTHTVVMTQRVTPPHGEPPEVQAHGYKQAGSSAQPTGFTAYGTLDAPSTYSATASGHVSDEAVSPFDDIAPGATGHVSFMSLATSFPGHYGMEKARGYPGYTRTEGPDGRLVYSGLAYTISTARALSGTIPSSPLAGTMHDGDSGQWGIVANIGNTNGGHEGLPSQSGGVLTTDWDGSVPMTWSDNWPNPAPGLEPYATRSARSQTPSSGGNPRYLAKANAPIIVTGGDIDNRDGDAAVEGHPIVMQLPGDLEVSHASLLTMSAIGAPTNYAWKWLTDFDAGTVAVVPRIEPGGYWLESTIDGYDRRWSPHAHVLGIVAEKPEDVGGSGDGVIERQDIVVSPGSQATLEAVDASGTLFARRHLPAGEWQVVIDPVARRLHVSRTG